MGKIFMAPSLCSETPARPSHICRLRHHKTAPALVSREKGPCRHPPTRSCGSFCALVTHSSLLPSVFAVGWISARPSRPQSDIIAHTQDNGGRNPHQTADQRRTVACAFVVGIASLIVILHCVLGCTGDECYLMCAAYA